MRALLLCMHGGGREGGATPSREGRGIIIQVEKKRHLVRFL